MDNFYPRSPCGERPHQCRRLSFFPHFYPRSPCGERPPKGIHTIWVYIFLSTLSLRRATVFQKLMAALLQFLSTLSLRRATHIHSTSHGRPGISIHALLAESDANTAAKEASTTAFLSTLSLRRATTIFAVRPYDAPIFLSTLSLRRATAFRSPRIALMVDFYPRSPCGERQTGPCTDLRGPRFLSTLSLRRATVATPVSAPPFPFLSTLSLRRATYDRLGRP